MAAVELLIERSGWLAAMAALIFCSAFFSCSEAALFYLRRQDRRNFMTGNLAQRMAVQLLEKPDRLLTAVLFWNLLVNIVYFALAAIVSLHLAGQSRQAEASLVAVGAFIALILLGEMLPKSFAVLHTRFLASFVSIPLAVTVRLVDPLAPVLRGVILLSRRLIYPNFKPEPYMHLGDLERAIELSTTDVASLEQEQTVLNNLVSLSDIRVDELMRPRTQYLSFRPPVTLADLKGQIPPSGYLLVTEPDGDDVAAAIPLKHLSEIPERTLEHHAVPVVNVPWCTTAAVALEEMRQRNRRVAAVINEFGETIGIITFDDLLATIFSDSPSRSARLLRTVPIQQIQPGIWHVTGMTSLRRLARYFQTTLPETYSITVAGVTQEVLQRLPVRGDEVEWGPFRWTVLEAPERGQITVELTCK